jgi:hypothetical protein
MLVPEMATAARPGGRMILCSYGINDHQITPETLAALRDCDVVYSEPLSDAVRYAVEGACPAIKLLGPGKTGAVAEKLIAQVKAGRKVACLTYGDPLFLNDFCRLLMERCEKEKLPWRQYRGISSLNELIGALRLGDHRGVGLYVTWVGEKTLGFCTDVPALVFSFGVGSPDDANTKRFIDAIQRLYPEDHEVESVSASSNQSAFLRKKYRVGELPRAWREASHHSTLLIPAVVAA